MRKYDDANAVDEPAGHAENTHQMAVKCFFIFLFLSGIKILLHNGTETTFPTHFICLKAHSELTLFFTKKCRERGWKCHYTDSQMIVNHNGHHIPTVLASCRHALATTRLCQSYAQEELPVSLVFARLAGQTILVKGIICREVLKQG